MNAACAARVVGVGALTCAGSGVDAFWQACAAARPGLARHTLDGIDDARFCGFARRHSAVEALTTALEDAVATAELTLARWSAPRVALFAGSSLGGMATYEALHRRWWAADASVAPASSHPVARYDGPAHVAGAAVLDSLGRSVGTWTVNTACSSAANALGMARNWLVRRRIDVAIVAGYDVISPFVYAGFACLNAMDLEPSSPFSLSRAGLNLGEAAVAFVLVRADVASPGGVGLIGYGSSCDAHHLTRPDLSGSGLARAVRSALVDGGVGPDHVSMVSAHGTGTLFNDQMESAALSTVFSRCPPVHCAKPVVGHTLGAAGAIDALLCIEALRRHVLPPTYRRMPADPTLTIQPSSAALGLPPGAVALSTSSGFGGSNAALLFAELA